MTHRLKHFVYLVAVAALLGAASHAFAQESASGGYKIGVVDIEKVVESYDKKIQKMAALKQRVDSEQAKIDAMTKELEAKKSDFDKSRDTMSDEQRNAMQAELGVMVNSIKSKTNEIQIQIDKEEANIRNEVFADVEAAIQAIAAAEGYHLVLNARGVPNSSVLFASPTIDISSKVTAKLGSGGGGAAPAPAKESGKDSKKKN